MRTAGKLAWTMWVFIAIVAVATFAAGALTPAATPAPTGYSHTQLEADLRMTEQMSVPGAGGPMFDGAVVDDQLRRSQDPAYVSALEDHQREIDRMLGRAAP